MYINPDDELDMNRDMDHNIGYNCDMSRALIDEYVQHEEAILLKCKIKSELEVESTLDVDEDEESQGERFERLYRGVNGTSGSFWAPERCLTTC